MKTMTRILLATATMIALGCPSDDTPANDTGDTDPDTSNSNTDPSATSPTATDPSATMTSPTTTADTSGTDTMTTVDPDSSGTSDESSSTTVDPTIFVFNDTPPEKYMNVDRKGFPAVNTGTQIHGDKDAYNLGTPEDDAALTFIPETLASLGLLHWGPDALNPPNPPGPGLDEELTGFGIVPCEAPQVGFLNSCAIQGAPAVVPDVLKIDTDLTAGFHFDATTCGPVANGRRLADPVVDIILAVLLVDLTQPIPDGWGIPCPTKEDPGAPASVFLSIGALGGLSLNPIANDVPFDDAFPYLAPAHE